MIYRSNLTCPDLTPYFKHLTCRVMGHSFGHDVLSDWSDKADDDPVFGIYKNCGFWTHDEAAILYNVAKRLGPCEWLDIGCHTGWTTGHIAAAFPIPFDVLTESRFNYVFYLDPMLANWEFLQRFNENFFQGPGRTPGSPYPYTSNYYFEQVDCRWGHPKNPNTKEPVFGGVCIDGDHEPGAPLLDAQNAAKHLAAETGVIMLHDGVGKPVQDAVQWLMGHDPYCNSGWYGEPKDSDPLRTPGYPRNCNCGRGFKARAYSTPHLVFCCWRGDFTPPDHVPDPEVKRQLLDGRFADFPWEKMQ